MKILLDQKKKKKCQYDREWYKSICEEEKEEKKPLYGRI